MVAALRGGVEAVGAEFENERSEVVMAFVVGGDGVVAHFLWEGFPPPFFSL